MLIREKKLDKLEKIRFDCIACLETKAVRNSKLYLRIYEKVMNGKHLVLDCPVAANYDPKFDCFRFPKI